MKKFRFSLETLLKVREGQVKEMRRSLMEVEKKFRDLKEETLSLEKNMHAQEVEIKQKRIAGDLADEIARNRHLYFLKNEWQERRVEMLSKLTELREKQKDATILLKKRKVIEKIKQKKYAQWQEIQATDNTT